MTDWREEERKTRDKLETALGIIRTARSNLMLRHCNKCNHLHMSHTICYSCGHDNSVDEEHVTPM